MNTENTNTAQVLDTLAGYAGTFPLIQPRADAVANLLARADARWLNRLRDDKPLTGFGGLQ
jgi:hypothetical protein